MANRNKKLNKELGKGLYRRSNGKISARFTSISGKRIEKYFDNEKDAKEWLEEAKYKDRHGGIVLPSDMSVDAWFDFFIEEIKKPTVRPNTWRNYIERYKQNIKPYIGGMNIGRVTELNCIHILNKMTDDYKNSTIYQTYITMNCMFRSAVRYKHIAVNPVCFKEKGIPKSKRADADTKIRFLSIEEQKKFLKAAEGTSNYPQYRLILETGLRSGEVIGLKWSDIDFEKRTISVNRSLEYRYSTKEWKWGEPKNRSYRAIPMTDVCYQLLCEVREKQKCSDVVIADEQFKDLVFINRKGLPTKNSAYDTTLFKLADKAGIERFSMHPLRHTFATRCIEAGMRPKTLQILLGHKSLSVTMQTYVHVTMEAKAEEMQKFAEYLNEKEAS